VRLLESQLTSPPVLAHFDLASPTLIRCDASALAIGTVMSQLQGGVERPIAFASRALSPTEQRYLVGEREALTCHWACERWHMYLYRHSFTLRTAHQALTTLLATSSTGHKPLSFHRCADRLHQYNYRLQFTPGCDNVVADLQSRAIPNPPAGPSLAPGQDTTEYDLAQLLHTPLRGTVSLKELQKASADPVLFTPSTYIRQGWPAKVPDELLTYSWIRKELSRWNDTYVARTVVPGALWVCVLAMAHEGHLGIVRLKQQCFNVVWWPGNDREIETLVKDCTACLLSGKTRAPAPPHPCSRWIGRPSPGNIYNLTSVASYMACHITGGSSLWFTTSTLSGQR